MRKKSVNRRRLLLFVALLFCATLIFSYLYRNNIIFVKKIEHGILVDKLDCGDSFKYDLFFDEELHSFKTKDKSIDLNHGVVNFKYRKDTIVKFLGYAEPISDKVMARTDSSIEFEYLGNMEISSDASTYRLSGKHIAVKSINSIIPGAENIRVFKDKKGRIKTIILDGDSDLSVMRVGIKNQGFESFSHDSLDFISEGPVTVVDKKDNRVIALEPETKITLMPSEGGIRFDSEIGSTTFKNRVYIIPSEKDKLIKILSFERSYGNPKYRGDFEVTNSSGSLRLINEIDLEKYLYQVVPSEMPASFGSEALKAQAVAARTYAVRGILNGTYAKDGFHVDDSTMDQVYNNIFEDPTTAKAVNETNGLVMKYDGSLIDAKYYSTSHGYGANAHEIWSREGNFPGDKIPYLVAGSHLLDHSQYNLSSETMALEFFKNWDLKSYDSDSPYFRWKTTLTKEELQNTIEKNLPITYEDHKDFILTLKKDGEFKSVPIAQNPLGELTDIKVTKRGEGGNIMELKVSGTNGTYKVVKELNVRYVIRPRNSDTGSKEDVIIERLNGKELKNSSLLPSAFMSFEIERDGDGIKSVTFYGGGYGHSVGMSQYGAKYLASQGYSFDKILKTYYKDIIIEKLY